MSQVERGIQIPPQFSGRSRFDWSALQVGESYSSDDAGIRDSAAYYRKKNPGWGYTFRLDVRDRKYRVWRIS